MKKICISIVALVLVISLTGCIAEELPLETDGGTTSSSISSINTVSDNDIVESSTTTTTTKATTTVAVESVQTAYVLNTHTMKFHRSNCRHIKTMDAENRQDFTGSREQVIGMGYSACGTCKP